jgi:hypothetical protein
MVSPLVRKDAFSVFLYTKLKEPWSLDEPHPCRC